MDNPKAELNRLFVEWENDPFHDKKSFIKDGIIDYGIWEEKSPKILCLFKEAYTKGKERYDLDQHIRDNAPHNNW